MKDISEWTREELLRELHRLIAVSPEAVYCAYCGHEYPPGTPTDQHTALTRHIKQCEKHPMRELEEMLKIADMLAGKARKLVDDEEGNADGFGPDVTHILPLRAAVEVYEDARKNTKHKNGKR